MTGGVRIQKRDPLIVWEGDSVAVLYGVAADPRVIEAGTELTTTIREAVGEAVLVLVDDTTASVYVLRRAELLAPLAKPGVP